MVRAAHNSHNNGRGFHIHDCRGGLIAHADKMLPYRILIWPKLVRLCDAYQHGAAASRAVVSVEPAATQQADAHQLKISGGDDTAGGFQGKLARISGMAFRIEHKPRVITGH